MLKKWLLLTAITFFAYALCASPPTVSVSIYPIYDIVNKIGQQHIQPMLLIPPDANPHTFEPTPQAVSELQNAQIFIGIDSHFDGWTQKFLPPTTASYNLMPTIFGEGRKNPHIWLSLLNAKKIANEITKILGENMPDYANVFQQNNALFQSQLDSLHQELIALFAPLSMRKFIQWHPAWNDFAADYQLEIIGTIEEGHGHEPSVRDFMQLIQKAKQQQVKTVVLGLNLHNKNVDALVREIDGRIARLDAIGSPDRPQASSYLKMMKQSAKTLANALKEK